MKYKKTGFWLLFLLAFLFLPPLEGKEKNQPLIKTPEGTRAWGELRVFYRTGRKPNYQPALDDFSSPSAETRKIAVKYLLALFKQSARDLKKLEGLAKSQVEHFRLQLAREIARKAGSKEVLPLAKWLLREDSPPQIRTEALWLLGKIPPKMGKKWTMRLLSSEDLTPSMEIRLLDLVGQKKWKSFLPQVRSRVNHYRKDMRIQARQTARSLGIEKIPPFRPEKALRHYFQKKLKQYTSLLLASEVSAKASWCLFISREKGWDKKPSFVGWKLKKGKKHWQVVDYLGRKRRLPFEKWKVKSHGLVDDIELLNALRLHLSPGGVSANFKARQERTQKFHRRFSFLPSLSLSLEEEVELAQAALVLWTFGQKKYSLTARLLFGALNRADGDDEVWSSFRASLLKAYAFLMYRHLCYRRDYPEALRLARHVRQDLWKGEKNYRQAEILIRDIPRRQGDYGKFTLPTPAEWREKRAKLSRKEQILYLRNRLVLLNGETNRFGHMNYSVHHSSLSQEKLEDGKKGQNLINPYRELEKLRLTLKDLQLLAPYFKKNTFTLSFEAGLRGVHLHTIPQVIDSLFQKVTIVSLFNWKAYPEWSKKKQKKAYGELLQWLKKREDWDQSRLALSIVKRTKVWDHLEEAAEILVEKKVKKAAALLLKRMDYFYRHRANPRRKFVDDFYGVKTYPRHRRWILRWIWRLDRKVLLGPARKWIESEDLQLKHWAALVLVSEGDKSRREGASELGKWLLEQKSLGSDFWRGLKILEKTYPQVALEVMVHLVKRDDYRWDRRGTVLHRLILGGKKEGLDFILEKLQSSKIVDHRWIEKRGKKVRIPLTEADELGRIIARWKRETYKISESPEKRRKKREKLARWLKVQFERIKAGKKSNLPERFPPREW